MYARREGNGRTEQRKALISGFEAMIEAVKPLRLLIYGRLPIRTDIPCIEVLPDWVRLRKMT